MQVTGTVGDAITIVGATRAAIQEIARKLIRWSSLICSDNLDDQPRKRILLMYRTERGVATLDLASRLDIEVLTSWLEDSYAIIEDEASQRD